MKKEITIDGIKYIRVDEDSLQVGDYVRVVDGSESAGYVGQIKGVTKNVHHGWHYDVKTDSPADNMPIGICFIYAAGDLQKITPKEYEQERELLEEGWIPHVGDECPVEATTTVEAGYGYSSLGQINLAKNLDWQSITHYRIVEQKKENPYGLGVGFEYPLDSVDIHIVGVKHDKRKVKKMQEALNTFLELLSCEGVEEKVNNKKQHLIETSASGRILLPKSYRFYSSKVIKISPAFDTKENEQKAINKIGEDRLMQMFNVLGGKFDE